MISGTKRHTWNRLILTASLGHFALLSTSGCSEPADDLRLRLGDDARPRPDAGGVDSGVSAPRDRICDGSQELRFAARVQGGSPTLTPAMMLVHGFSYLYVRGDCTYWVNLNAQRGAVTYRGTLDERQERELIVAYDYAALSAGTIETRPSSALHHVPLLVSDGSYTADMSGVRDVYRGHLASLRSLGKPCAGPLRVVGRKDEASLDDGDHTRRVTTPWPFTWSIDDTLSDVAGPGMLVTDETRTADWASFRAGSGGAAESGPTVPSWFRLGEDLGLWYSVYVRDAIELEDDRGEVVLPAPRWM